MRVRMLRISVVCAALAWTLPLSAQNCQETSVGSTPLSDLGTGTYMGFEGGLYPGGSNQRPPAHHAAGLAQAASVVPRDAAGDPDPNGKVVFVSIGMSNTRAHRQAILGQAAADPQLSSQLLLVQGAQGGQPAEAISDPDAPYWDFVQNAVQQAGATNAQVQVLWLLQANAGPSDPFPQHAQNLREQLETIVQIARDLFPNARLAYVAARIYAGYATTMLNPEPYAYENGFALKWLVESQIQGDPG